jgi:hypothetical protein
MNSVAVDKITDVFGYIDALKDLGIMSAETHVQIVRDLHDARALIIQSLERYERLVKDK